MALTRLLPLRFRAQSRLSRWPWVAWAAAWTLTAAGLGLFALTYSVTLGPRWGPRGVLAVGAALMAPMGAVVASRRPNNPIGWLYCCIGVLCGAQFLAQEYAVLGVLARPGALPWAEWMAWLQNWLWVPPAALYFIFVPLLLPEGRLPSRRWRAVLIYAALAVFMQTLFVAIQPGRMSNFSLIDNPLVTGLSPALWNRLNSFVFAAFDLAVLAAAVSLVWRARHVNALERQQLKWLALAFTLGAAGVSTVNFVAPALAAPVLGIAFMVMHATTGLAILRYRLYDLDVVLNRTVVYGVLTAALVGIYFGCVVLLQNLAVTFTGRQRSELVTVLSTLAIAALFSPLRSRIQRIIDERFFRRKYDASKALARFGQTIAGDSSGDLDWLNAALIRVVDETLEPESVWLWTKP
jgi:hypothetical protein